MNYEEPWVKHLRKHLNGFDLVELWVYIMSKALREQEYYVWIVEGGSA
jgi:hypothetical protein